MSGFTEAALERKLAELNNSQQSIQTLSLWLIHHRKHHKTIVHVWLRELKKAKPARKLTFMYLANDVIQNSKKKGPEFTKEFATVLAKAFAHISVRDTDQKTHAGLRRILSVWKERSVFDSHQISDFGQYLSDKVSEAETVKDSGQDAVYRKGHAPVSHEGTPLWNDAEPAAKRKKPSDPGEEPSEKTDAAKDAEKPGEPPDPGVLIKALADLENTASSDAVVRERIASLPPEVSDASLLEKIQDRQAADRLSAQVEEACSLLAEYNSRLAQELEDRKQVSQMLASFTFHQRELMALAEQKLEEHRDKLHKVTHVRNELKSHLQNLPDLTLLPSVTGGLAPLPSAGDLFSHQ
ncbi:regulation of nuclear pre-mRNA domain-containing protein 1B isoform X1 [Rhipicephalus sanguineus]|uniref:regulation of nuclear pre-mRNA domain-containing protein 1B isoform X1 n=1 Tax=Rhipicephalus sanguineus TaxID=34632 RepID=UPI001893BBCE|nr:regulation of nuclear pre-mRNA domain-containing protein 1B isoform X1 [Rhipicephalus sanguineus]